jgi:kynurenine/2-aminoadipate aminotransferase
MVAGMFLWLRLTHVRDSRALIQEKARERKVLLVPGADFSSEEGAVSSCVRASFSTASAVDMEEAVRRLSHVVLTLYVTISTRAGEETWAAA